MKSILGRLETFELICTVCFLILLSSSIYFFSNSNIVWAILLFALSLWALSIPLGKIFFVPAYLEGHIVRLLMRNSGTMEIQDIQKYYEQYDSMDFAFDQLKNRGVINIIDTIIELVCLFR